MVAVAVMMMVMAVMPRLAGRSAAHGDAARFAKLPVFRFHAGGDPRHVGDDFRTKPHRIGRTGLAGGVAALCGRAVEGTEKYCQQADGASEVNDAHGYPLGWATFLRG